MSASSRRGSPRGAHVVASLAAALGGLACAVGPGCAPSVLVGDWTCAQASGPADAAASSADGGALDVPWSTSFEDGFCDYASALGYCYAAGGSAYTIVSSPVHSGRYAAAFTVDSRDTPLTGTQTRCVRQGILPTAAYYGAWYFVPAVQSNGQTWNLFYFEGGDGPNAALHGLWDVSLVNAPDGGLHLSIYDFLNPSTPDTSAVPDIPIGAWFHIEFFFHRAADATGEIALYQDGQAALDLTGIPTDDSTWGRWHVGNLADSLVPPVSTVYVDDVTIRATP
jgi:hypothetical protein